MTDTPTAERERARAAYREARCYRHYWVGRLLAVSEELARPWCKYCEAKIEPWPQFPNLAVSAPMGPLTGPK